MADEKCYHSGEHCAFLRIELEKDKSVIVLPYGSLLYAELTPETTGDKHQLMKLTFATHDVKVTGHKLDEVIKTIQMNTCHSLFKTNSSEAAYSKYPTILKIDAKAIIKR